MGTSRQTEYPKNFFAMTNIQNITELEKRIVKYHPKPKKAKRLDTITESVGGFQEKKRSSSLSLCSRIENQQIKKLGQTLKTNLEIQQNKNTRHTYCGYITKAEYIKILKSKKNNYHFNGFATCKMVWRCPSCSYKILKHRANEIYQLTSAHHKTKKQLGFITLTIKHSKKDSLKQSQEKLITGYRNFQNTYFFKKLKKSNLIGQIKAYEHTITQKNGWHPHLHTIMFYNTQSESEVLKIQKEFIKQWAKYTKGSINAQNQKPVYSLGEISEYITKWDSIQELTNTQNKSSKGIAPFQLLKMLNNNELLFDYTDTKKSNQKLKSLWLEYVETTKGKRRLTISPKLNELYKVTTKTDEEICDTQILGTEQIAFTRQTGILIFEQNIQAYLINICYENETLEQRQKEIINFIKQFTHISIRMEKNLLIINSLNS